MTTHLLRRLLLFVLMIACLLPLPHPTYAYSEGTFAISFSPDSRYAAAAWVGGTALVYEIESATKVATLDCETDHVFSFAWTASTNFLACGGYLGAVLFETQTWTKARTYPYQMIAEDTGNVGDVYSMAFSADGSLLLMGGATGARIWDVASGEMLHYMTNIVPNDETRQFYEMVAFSPDGRYVAINSYDENIGGEPTSAASLWDVQTGEMLHAFEDTALFGPEPFSPDGRQVLVGGPPDGLEVWDIEGGTVVQTISTYGTGWGTYSTDMTRIAFTYGTRMGLGSSLSLLDPTKAYPLKEYARNGLLSPDGKWIVTVDGAAITNSVLVELWDAETGVAVYQLDPSANYTTNVYLFSPDSRYLMTGSLFIGAEVWGVETGDLLFEFSD